MMTIPFITAVYFDISLWSFLVLSGIRVLVCRSIRTPFFKELLKGFRSWTSSLGHSVVTCKRTCEYFPPNSVSFLHIVFRMCIIRLCVGFTSCHRILYCISMIRNDVEREAKAAARLLTAIVSNCKGRIDRYIPYVLQLVRLRLDTAFTSTLRIRLLEVVLATMYYDPLLVAELFRVSRETV